MSEHICKACKGEKIVACLDCMPWEELQRRLDAHRMNIQELRGKGGTIDLTLESSREWAAIMVGHARNLLGEAPNYSETKLEGCWRDGGSPKVEMEVGRFPERFIITIQRAGKLTPHEARVKAEARVAELEAQLAAERQDTDDWQDAAQAAEARVAELETQIQAWAGAAL